MRSAMYCFILPEWVKISLVWEELCSQPDSLEVNILVNKLGTQGPA